MWVWISQLALCEVRALTQSVYVLEALTPPITEGALAFHTFTSKGSLMTDLTSHLALHSVSVRGSSRYSKLLLVGNKKMSRYLYFLHFQSCSPSSDLTFSPVSPHA